ncbi:acyltransferase domain-containing protein [Methylosinus sp. Ce-a6]|uniref:acyltransferase domain-containing protein n=1 Tax=Methylosinus sp. Ce-a6 TaxID=2172005 RepID=UPI001356E086|nr:acyltransferase domain-containing protein [Methylosinus sp. Ce-a6]
MKAVVFSGQGAQRPGMGRDLFGRFPALVALADRTLGYSVEELCLEDPRSELSRTAFTQPAIYVVSTLAYLEFERTHGAPALLAGHSVGEYAALTAAGVFDFEIGLRLVQRRAELMGRADGGGLTAILGISPDEVGEMLARPDLAGLEPANFNTPRQTVVGGPSPLLARLERLCAESGRRAVRLNVSGAFHTSAMREASEEFGRFVTSFAMAPPKIPVALNLTGRLHAGEDLREVLPRHIASPVRWSDCIATLLREGATEFVELPSTGALSRMANEIRSAISSPPPVARQVEEAHGDIRDILGRRLVSVSLGRGISGLELTRSLGRAGVLAFIDTEDAPLDRLEADLSSLVSYPTIVARVGASLTPSLDAEDERRRVDLFVRLGVRNVELRGYERPSEAALRYRSPAPERGLRRLFVRVTRASAVDAFLDVEAGDGDPFAAALCVDTGVWRSRESEPEDALRHALSRREAARRDGGPAGKTLIGVVADPASSGGIAAAFEAGCDFVTTGSAMLLADEARLDSEMRAAIRDPRVGAVAGLPDWWLPELATRSTAWIDDPGAIEEVLNLQNLYLRSPDTETMRGAVAPFARTADGHGSREREARKALRRTAAGVFRRLIPCDPAFDSLRRWIVARADGHGLSAARIAEMLLPPSVEETHPTEGA